MPGVTRKGLPEADIIPDIYAAIYTIAPPYLIDILLIIHVHERTQKRT
jgi:hypothetical protein